MFRVFLLSLVKAAYGLHSTMANQQAQVSSKKVVLVFVFLFFFFVAVFFFFRLTEFSQVKETENHLTKPFSQIGQSCSGFSGWVRAWISKICRALIGPDLGAKSRFSVSNRVFAIAEIKQRSTL